MESEESEMIVKFDEVMVDGKPTKIWSAFQKLDGKPCLGVSPDRGEAITYCTELMMEDKNESRRN
tara:strand:- start:5854 stop:6048 length:195 start_codon:yes stop_codon:yes gene_type:complete